MLFIAALPKVSAFKPNKPADPALYELLMEAHQVGVEIRSMGMAYHQGDSFVYLLDPDLTIGLC